MFVSAGNKNVHAERKNNNNTGIIRYFFIIVTPEAWSMMDYQTSYHIMNGESYPDQRVLKPVRFSGDTSKQQD